MSIIYRINTFVPGLLLAVDAACSRSDPLSMFTTRNKVGLAFVNYRVGLIIVTNNLVSLGSEIMVLLPYLDCPQLTSLLCGVSGSAVDQQWISSGSAVDQQWIISVTVPEREPENEVGGRIVAVRVKSDPKFAPNFRASHFLNPWSLDVLTIL